MNQVQPVAAVPRFGAAIKSWHPLARGLSSAWLFNEGRGIVVTSSVYPYRQATLTQGTWVNDNFGWPCLSFNGNNTRAAVTSMPELDSAVAFTLSVWLQQRTVPATDYVFAKIVDASNGVYILPKVAGGLECGVNSAGAKNATLNTYASYIAANTWVHLSLAFDGTGSANADRLKLYIDGRYVAFSAFTGTLPAATPNLAAATAYWGYTGSALDGLMRAAYVHNRALSADEIAQLYRDPFQMFEPAVAPIPRPIAIMPPM